MINKIHIYCANFDLALCEVYFNSILPDINCVIRKKKLVLQVYNEDRSDSHFLLWVEVREHMAKGVVQ